MGAEREGEVSEELSNTGRLVLEALLLRRRVVEVITTISPESLRPGSVCCVTSPPSGTVSMLAFFRLWDTTRFFALSVIDAAGGFLSMYFLSFMSMYSSCV